MVKKNGACEPPENWFTLDATKSWIYKIRVYSIMNFDHCEGASSNLHNLYGWSTLHQFYLSLDCTITSYLMMEFAYQIFSTLFVHSYIHCIVLVALPLSPST